MSTIPVQRSKPETAHADDGSRHAGLRQTTIAWSAFLFAFLQSACTAFAALSGVRLVVGATSLAISAGMAATLGPLHVDWIRLPMVGLAFAGATLNLIVLWQLRRLRARPAAQWRVQPVSVRKLYMERLQFLLSIATLVLVGIEEYLHILWHHRV